MVEMVNNYLVEHGQDTTECLYFAVEKTFLMDQTRPSLVVIPSNYSSSSSSMLSSSSSKESAYLGRSLSTDATGMTSLATVSSDSISFTASLASPTTVTTNSSPVRNAVTKLTVPLLTLQKTGILVYAKQGSIASTLQPRHSLEFKTIKGFEK
jgi:hypothetical protein